MTKKTGLGRGLGSLISGGVSPQPSSGGKKTAKSPGKTAKKKSNSRKKAAPARKTKADPKQPASAGATLPEGTIPFPGKEDAEPRETALGLYEIAVNRIIPNPHQPRREFPEDSLKELADSIRSEGLLQPVVVRKREDKFELVAGERRWRACQSLKLKQIPARVIEASESSSAVLSLIENLQREDLNPIEEAMGYASLMKDFDLTQEQAAERVGRSRASVANALRLLQLAREIQGYLIKGLVSVGHAKVLLGLENPENRLLLARESIERGWSVRDLERQVERLKSRAERPGKSRSPVPADEEVAINDLQKQLSSTFSTRVVLKHTPKKGRIIIEYYGNDDLQRIMEKMGLH
ncbi:MAG: ParB/RepB/Spo0J family partition protein [Oceanipulchritudo sp.]